MLFKTFRESQTKKKIWFDKSSEFYNRLMKPWSQNNDLEMHSTHNEEKSVFMNDLLEA